LLLAEAADDAALSAPGSPVFLCGAYRFAGDIGRGLVAALPPLLSLPTLAPFGSLDVVSAANGRHLRCIIKLHLNRQ
jgi:hypothetical protein